jgi:ribonucleotide reductase alpha subunit
VHRDHAEHNDDEIAVCNLGSVNLPAHMKEGKLDHDKLPRPSAPPCACSTT